MKGKAFKFEGDVVLIALVVFLALFGVLMVYSSSNYSALADYNDKFYFAKKQALGFVAGLVVMAAMCMYPHGKLKKLKWISLAVSLALLGLVFIPGLGKESYGADRWIILGPLTIQPSEI